MSDANPLAMLSPLGLGYSMPAEWEPHAVCWMAWPTDHEQWDDLSAVEQAYAAVANAIARFEPVAIERWSPPNRRYSIRTATGAWTGRRLKWSFAERSA